MWEVLVQNPCFCLVAFIFKMLVDHFSLKRMLTSTTSGIQCNMLNAPMSNVVMFFSAKDHLIQTRDPTSISWPLELWHITLPRNVNLKWLEIQDLRPGHTATITITMARSLSYRYRVDCSQSGFSTPETIRYAAWTNQRVLKSGPQARCKESVLM